MKRQNPTDGLCLRRHLQAADEVRRVLCGVRRQRAARGAQHDDAGAAGAAEVALPRYEQRVHHACSRRAATACADKSKGTHLKAWQKLCIRIQQAAEGKVKHMREGRCMVYAVCHLGPYKGLAIFSIGRSFPRFGHSLVVVCERCQ